MSILYYSFKLGELYDAVGSGDRSLLDPLEIKFLYRDPELLTVIRAILTDGLLYHDLFSENIYNLALTQIVQVLPSYRQHFDDQDYQSDYHDTWRQLPRDSLLRRYWNYITHGRYLFDHPVAPATKIRYGYLTRDELPEFLHLVEQQGELLPWYFFQHTIDTIQQTLEEGNDLFVAIRIKDRRYRVIRPGSSQEQ